MLKGSKIRTLLTKTETLRNVFPNYCQINFTLEIKNIYECLKSVRAFSAPVSKSPTGLQARKLTSTEKKEG